MEILKIVENLQSCSYELIAEKLGSPFAEAVCAAVPLLIYQGERISDLESEITVLNTAGLTPEEIAFFRSPEMTRVCRYILAAYKEGYFDKGVA